MIEPLLLSVTSVITKFGTQQLTSATGFFFERENRLYLITARHVVLDEGTQHRPNILIINLHINEENITITTDYSIPLYRENRPLWMEAYDSGGLVDVCAIELDRKALGDKVFLEAFHEDQLVTATDDVEVGTSAVIAGFPLGFYDTLHKLPVARNALIASSFGIRFQGLGYFLTDAQMHRGSSGAPVVIRVDSEWHLIGIHTSRMDMVTRDKQEDDRLNLNCAWYADVILELTKKR
ncbi:serine protease [Leptospira ognonensis]|uniref:Serine protease n=1 Tax=Leptospira ognonensis TaxID=2484945 RepID=A0A4R9K4V8_9LEPT|nr:serine protease [Leptospira ognonensis]TGL61189.1 serine protease [Leptospira ognonensis]